MTENDTKAAENGVVDGAEEYPEEYPSVPVEETESVETEEEKEEEPKIRGLNALLLSIPDGGAKKAFDVLFTNSFGNQANKQIYSLQKELGVHIDEYNHLRAQLEKDPENLDKDKKKFIGKGLVELNNLNETVGLKEIELEVALPIKLRFLSCFCSNDRIVLESMGIAEFED